MRRAVVIVLVAISVVIAAIALLVAYTSSPVGRRALADFAERRIERVAGGAVEIGALTGPLLRRIELNDIQFTNEGERWASISRVTFTWAPRALLSRRVEMGAVVIEDATLIARPPARESKGDFRGLELPDRLPAVSIGRIEIRNLEFGAALSGEALRLDGEGAVDMGGSDISIRAKLKEQTGRDDVEIDIRRRGAALAPLVSVQIRSKADGAIAALSGAGGAVSVVAEGSGPPTAYRLKLTAEAGAYGVADAEAEADIGTLESISFKITAAPGARFERWRADIGDQVTASGVLHPAEGGARLTLGRLSGAFGDLSGEAVWSNDRTALKAADATLTARFAPGWRVDFQRLIGDQADAQISLDRRGRAYVGTASVVAPAASAAIASLKTDLRTRVEGSLTATVSEKSALARPLGASIRGAAILSVAPDEPVSLRGLTLTSADGASFKGDVSYRPADRWFVIDGAAAASAPAIRALAPAISPRGEAKALIKVSGSPDAFSGTLSGSAPAFEWRGTAWPASTLSLSLSDLPSAAIGEISIRAADGSMRSFARIRRNNSGLLALSAIDHRGDGFTLTGNAAFNLDEREGAIDLVYAGEDGAEPWPGVVLAGEASAKGALAKGRGESRITIKISALRTKLLAIEGATMTARGPADRMSFETAAAALSLQERIRVEDLKISGLTAIGERTSLTLQAASADIQGATARLARPAEIALGDGVSVEDLSILIGERGAIDFSGALAPRRWRAAAVIRDLVFSANDSALDFNLALDTDKSPVATGEFSVDSGLARQQDATLAGRYSWDAMRLAVSAEGGRGALSLDLDLPLRLRRAQSLGVDLAGALRGTARYDGRAEAMALFLPLALQSLEGGLAFDSALSGTTDDPRLSGQLTLTDGAYTEIISGLSVVDIDLTAAAAATAESSSVTFAGTASGAGQSEKTIKASGKVNLAGGVTVATDIALDGARFAAGPVERVEATGALKVEGNPDDLLVSGDVEIETLSAKLFTPEISGLVDIDVVAVGAGGKPVSPNAPAARRGALRYAVRISADDKISVSGRGLNSEWRANAQLAGTSAQPLILGVMNLNRGDLEFSGRRFNLTRGSIGFDTLAPNDPTMDLRAERETRDGTTVAVVISGRSSALKVSLESTPSRPSEDVMALLLFDKPADELSAFESVQVADALTQLGGVGVFGGKGLTGAARDALGLDLINLEVDETDSSGSLLTVGKYVTDGLFVSASQNARGENGSLRIEYEIGQSFSVETELRQDGDQTVSANWRKDF